MKTAGASEPTKLVAVGVALIPDQQWCTRIIALNRALTQAHGGSENDTLVLGPDRLPHLTLYQCFVEAATLTQLVEAYASTLQSIDLPKSLPVIGLSAGNPVGRGQTTPWLDVCATNTDLQTAHAHARSHFRSHAHTAVSEAQGQQAFADPAVTPECIGFVNQYPIKADSGAYSPHITIGFGDFESIASKAEEYSREAKLSITFDRLVIGQLGNWCSLGGEETNRKRDLFVVCH